MKFLSFCFVMLLLSACYQKPGTDVSPVTPATDGKLQVDGRTRTYLLYVPATLDRSKPTPLLIALHGGSGSGMEMKNLTGFNRIADREGFIVVYPDAVEGNWNDGRNAGALPSQVQGVNDVKFMDLLVDVIVKNYNLDRDRIFASGISNGGIFSHYLACKLSNRILAIAPVVASIAEPVAADFKTQFPASALIINGTHDQLIHYQGGFVMNQQSNRGRTIAVEDAVRKWVVNNSCLSPPQATLLPDTDTNDGCKVTQFVYTGGRNATEVVFMKIEGGGHTWAGGTQYMPENVVGKVCRDFNASELIWAFFKRQKSRE